jgi:hypothetical protein
MAEAAARAEAALAEVPNPLDLGGAVAKAFSRGQMPHSIRSESGPRNVVLGWNRSVCPGAVD